MKEQLCAQADVARRERLLFACREAGLANVRVLKEGLSDRHNGGMTAALLEAEGKKYMYKPRSGRTDHAWADFLERMEKIPGMEVPGAVRPLTEGAAEYTVVPYVEGTEAKDEAAVRRYFRRCGGLLGLCMVLGSTDMHSENLIAEGDRPVLVDVETLLGGITPDRVRRGMTLYDSIVFSHLLPNWMLDGVGNNVDVGALTAEGKNLPRLDGKPCYAWQYTEEICAGFRSTVRGILQHRSEVEQALEGFAGASFRKLLRPTAAYDRLCRRIEAAQGDEERRNCAAALRRAYSRADADWAAKMARVCESEEAAVLRGDIPYFFCYGEETCLRDVQGVAAEDYFAVSPVDAARRRLASMTEGDGEDQERVIRQSLKAACPQAEPIPAGSAMDVFERLEGAAVNSSPCSWMGLHVDGRGAAYFQSVGFDLYDGLVGVLAFYGALYEVSGDERVRSALMRRYAPYREMYVERGGKLAANGNNISLTGGVGGHILALGYLARCLGEDSFLQDAAGLLGRFSFDRFDDFQNWDVFGGVCGLLMSLPLLKGRGMDGELARIAGILGRGVENVQPQWTGLAHGAAGLALGLAAAQFVGGGDFTGRIRELLEWENHLYDGEKLNWPDLRDPERKGFMKGICSGAPGIGLARLQTMRYVQDDRVREICEGDLERVRRFLQEDAGLLRRDSLCCGNVARMECEKTLNGQAAQTGMHDVPVFYRPLDTDQFSPGLFQGWAGIGYGLTACLPGGKNRLFAWEVDG